MVEKDYEWAGGFSRERNTREILNTYRRSLTPHEALDRHSSA